MSLKDANPASLGEAGPIPKATATWRSGLSSFLDKPTVQFLALVALFTFPAVLYLRDFRMTDPDFGWHLRAGQWILSNHTVPFTDQFSKYGLDNRIAWYDYSWLFDIFFALLYKAFGLLGFAYLEVAVRVAVPIFLYRMASRLGLGFWPSALLTALGAYSLTSIYAPRPGMFTIIFFILELQILFCALQTKRYGAIYWLPLLFWFWANIHIQFIHGLIVLGVFVCEPILNFFTRYRTAEETFPKKLMWVFPASVLATFLT